MKLDFVCTDCRKQFNAEGIKNEYRDPVYGPCIIYTTVCPFCGGEGREYSPNSSGDDNDNGMGSSCPSGGCCPGCGGM